MPDPVTVILDACDLNGERTDRPELIGHMLRAIAFAGRVNDWAAYAGPPWWTVSAIHDYGVKLEPALAARLFPALDASRYRR